MGQNFSLSINVIHVKGTFYIMIQSVIWQNGFFGSIIRQLLSLYYGSRRCNEAPFARVWLIYVVLDIHKLKAFVDGKSNRLIFSQMTNFRLFQTERVCRRQFQILCNWQKVLQKGENTVEKGEIASDEQFLLFPWCFRKTCTPDK